MLLKIQHLAQNFLPDPSCLYPGPDFTDLASVTSMTRMSDEMSDFYHVREESVFYSWRAMPFCNLCKFSALYNLRFQ